MMLTVFWTHFAQDKLEDIFEYYSFTSGIAVAEKITTGIIDASAEINKNPYGGQKEELLSKRIPEYRYVVFKNYKIIYRIDEIHNVILISHIFDTRRNPQKLQL